MGFTRSLAGMLLILSILLGFCGCGDRAYEKAIENYKTTTKYVGVRQDLVLISNFYDPVRLTEYGVSPNAYFLCGNADYIYFGVQNGANQQKIIVQEYSIANKSVRQCSEFAHAYRVQSIDGENFYYFTIKEDSFLGLNKTYTWEILRFKKDSSSGEMVHREEIGSSYPSLGDGRAYLGQYMSTMATYKWGKLDAGGRRTLSLTHEELAYQPFSLNSQDEIWNMVKDQPQPVAVLLNEHYYQANQQGVVIIRLDYEDHYNYFEYRFGGDVKFLFAQKVSDGGFQGLYVID